MHKNVNCILPFLTVRGSHRLGCIHTLTHARTHTHTQVHLHSGAYTRTHKQTPKNMKVAMQTNFGLEVCSQLILPGHFFFFSIIAQCLLYRLCQIITSFLHFSKENETIPWKLSSRAGLRNSEIQAGAKALALKAGNSFAHL